MAHKADVQKELEIIKAGIIEIRKYPVCGLLKPVRESLDSMATALLQIEIYNNESVDVWVAYGTNGDPNQGTIL